MSEAAPKASRFRCWTGDFGKPPETHLDRLERAAAACGGRVVGTSIVIDPAPPGPGRASCVYFIGGDDGAIKIGVSVAPEARLKGIQTGSPIRLRILATTPGDVETEAAYHARFAGCRVQGEWFERTPELIAEIERLARR